ncbi:SDR family oxidoreductase [Govanella unica]|uniref:SDR family oxidoreductase n=1 Tax=Govanella unica TaxID=2975056 RepID=A0A9X3Z6J3_9PROT|nr:SDR family oxidoreductase [Govania unica]MDA5192979.1 SDR family oxidoreductase [Govania unica]
MGDAMKQGHLFCFGYGLSAATLGPLLLSEGWRVTGTVRSAEKAARLAAQGVTPMVWEAGAPLPADALDGVTHILISILPDAGGDRVARALGARIATLPGLEWVGYLSTTGVYGDRGGGWIDEDSDLAPVSERGRQRLQAERDWQGIPGLPLQIFRLAGIYGPGRNQLEKLRAGTARRVIKPGHLFCRIHVADVAEVLRASIRRPDPGRVYNLADDEPAPPQDVVSFAAELLGVPPPPAELLDEAGMSEKSRSFYGATKRVHNDRIKLELGVKLKYPSYREGLRALKDA